MWQQLTLYAEQLCAAPSFRCTSLNPNFAKGHSREGTALKMLGKLPEAVQCFQRALSLEPSNESYKSSRDEAKRLPQLGLIFVYVP